MKKRANTHHVPISHEDLKGYSIDSDLQGIFIEIEYRRTTDDLFHMATHADDVAEALLEINRRKLERDFEIWKHLQKQTNDNTGTKRSCDSKQHQKDHQARTIQDAETN